MAGAKEPLGNGQILGDFVAHGTVTADSLVCLASHKQELTVRNDVLRPARVTHTLGATVAGDQNPEDLRLEEPLPEAVRFLVADHREQTDVFAEQRGQRTR